VNIASEDLLPGKILELRVKTGLPDKSRLVVESQKDPALTLGRGPGSPDDPTLHGALLLVASGNDAGAFTTVYPLDATTGGWNAVHKHGSVVGYTFKSSGPITTVKIRCGHALEVAGKGDGLGHDLDDDPDPVIVVLTIGEHAYCLEFGGKSLFKADERYQAKHAPAPLTCTPLPPLAP